MSLTDIVVTIEKNRELAVTVEKPKSVEITTPPSPGIKVIVAGNVGPPGPPGKWESLTQSEYDALSPPDPDTLYVIIG